MALITRNRLLVGSLGLGVAFLSACTPVRDGQPNNPPSFPEVFCGSSYDPQPCPSPKKPTPNPFEVIRRAGEDACQQATGYQGQDGGCAEEAIGVGVRVWDFGRRLGL